IPARPSAIRGLFLGAKASLGRTRRLGWLGPLLLTQWDIAHNRADGPRERHLVTVDSVVIGRPPAVSLALSEVVTLAVHAIDELAQGTVVHPAVTISVRQIPCLYLIDDAGVFIDGWRSQRRRSA